MHLDYPNVPYCGPLNSVLQPGAVILAKGQPNPGANYFAIALQCGSSTNFSDDIALYLSAAFTPPPRIIRNSLIANQWGPEESFGGFPTIPGQQFEIMILVEPNEYRIAINGQHFTEYRHRIPFETITHVSISGDVRIESFSIWYSQNAQTTMLSHPPAPGLYPSLPSDLHEHPPPYTSSAGQPFYPSMPYPTDVPYPSQPLPGPYGPSGQPPYPPPGGMPYPGQYSGPDQPPPGTHGYPPNYPTQNEPKKQGGGGIGSMIGTAVAGVTGAVAGSAISSRLLGHRGYGPSSMVPNVISSVMGGGSHGHVKQKHKKSSGIPIAGLAAGAGAAALGAALLSSHNPMKKMFKHKHKGSWSHKGWGRRGSSSSSSSSEEE